MPWTGKEFKSRHNHGMSASQATEAARVANAVLGKTGDEGQAIRIANAMAKKHHAKPRK